MQMPDEFWGAKAVSGLLGLLGAMVSLSILHVLSWRECIGILFSGTITAILFSQPIIDIVRAPPPLASGISFLIGTFGWSVLGAALNLIRKADLWGLVREIARSRWGRRE